MTKINQESITVSTGINGGKSLQVILFDDFNCFDIGTDGNIRILYKDDGRTFPVLTIHEAPQEIYDAYETALKAKEYL